LIALGNVLQGLEWRLSEKDAELAAAKECLELVEQRQAMEMHSVTQSLQVSFFFRYSVLGILHQSIYCFQSASYAFFWKFLTSSQLDLTFGSENWHMFTFVLVNCGYLHYFGFQISSYDSVWEIRWDRLISKMSSATAYFLS